MQKHKTWLQYAEVDLRLAKMANSSQNCLIVGVMYHAQQCIEKSLKAYMIYRNVTFPKIHDLTVLLHGCIVLDDEFSVLANRLAAEITLSAIKARYPEDRYPMLFVATAEESIAYADEVFQFVVHKTSMVPASQVKGTSRTIE